MPKKGRVLVLCSAHVNELLLTSQVFKEQYYKISEGNVMPKLFGFEIHEYTETPVYAADFTKKALGAAAEGTDRAASFAYYKPFMWKARGSVKTYLTLAENDALNKKNICSFNLYFKCRPKKLNYGVGAIVSETQA